MTYPEGREPLGADDMAKMHPSTWQQECETLRRDYSLMQIDRNNLRSLLDATEAKVDELHDKLDDAQADAKALRARVQELEAALRDVIAMTDNIASAPMTADRWADRIEDRARAVLQKQEGE